MSHTFETKMLELTSKKREILRGGAQLLKQKQIELDIEKYYDLNLLENADIRAEALPVLDDYQKQLLVEQEFYSEYHRTFVAEILELAGDLAPLEKERVLAISLLGLEENNATRKRINELKSSQKGIIRRLVEIFDVSEVNPSEEVISLESDEDIEELE